MIALLNFADHRPVLFFFSLLICAWVAIAPFRYAFKMYNRHIRARNIAARGWPPPSLDADGDVVERER
jgi:hypothetical protein